jgi:hypothetical protein
MERLFLSLFLGMIIAEKRKNLRFFHLVAKKNFNRAVLPFLKYKMKIAAQTISVG